MDDHAHAHTEKVVELAHPLRVALGQVIVDGDHVHAASGKSIQINRKCGDERFAFASLHLRDLARVQHHATDELHIEVTHIEYAPASFAHHCESLRKQLFHDFL